MTRKEKVEKLLSLVKDPSSSKEKIDVIYASYKKDIEVSLLEGQERVLEQLNKS
jgi:hypothetical protein